MTGSGAFGPGDGMSHAGAAPKNAVVKAGLARFGSAPSHGVATDIDDVGAERPDVLDVDAQLAPGGGQEVGHEHVGRAHQVVEDSHPVGLRDVERKAALASVALLDREAYATAALGYSRGGDLALRVSASGIFDLDHVGPEFGQHCAGRRNHVPAGHLHDADSSKDLVHGPPLDTSPTGAAGVNLATRGWRLPLLGSDRAGWCRWSHRRDSVRKVIHESQGHIGGVVHVRHFADEPTGNLVTHLPLLAGSDDGLWSL